MTFGVRPERLRVVNTSGEAHLSATVIVLEPMGADTLAMLDCAGHKLVARLPGDSALGSGAAVLLAMDADSVVLFDPQTGLR